VKNTTDIMRFRENWQDEVDSASEYRALAAVEPDPKIAKIYSNLARMEEAHIAFGKIGCGEQGRTWASESLPGAVEYWGRSQDVWVRKQFSLRLPQKNPPIGTGTRFRQKRAGPR